MARQAGRHLSAARRSLARRVALIFAAAVVVTALALALSAYFITRAAQEQEALDKALTQSRFNLFLADSMLPTEPTEADYERLVDAFQIRGDFATLIQVGDDPPYVSGFNVTRELITPELAAKVAEDRIGYQTVMVSGRQTLVVGGPVRAGQSTVYFFYPQQARLADLARLRDILIVGGVILAVLGAIAGYLLARRLLRPVRQASKAAVRMSQGDLDIRLPAGSDEFGVLAASFNRMAENLQAKMLDLEAGQARERRFAADVTHELRTPVSALVGEASLLKTRLEADPSACPPEVTRLVSMVNTDITRLRQLVDDLLEISRLEAQSAETVMEPVDLEPFLSQLLQVHGWSDSVRLLVRRATHQIDPGASRTDAIPPPGLVLHADRRRLERIVVNLVENALKHGAAPVSVEAHVDLGAAPDGPEEGRLVHIAISDSGPGIPAEHLSHVFDRFYKADPSRSSSRGSGLGLAIARENARLLGGDITAGNAPGGGARFVLTLPAAAS
ncbi:MAG: HAMP domain-containing histidine kinase [Thermoleophilia bacterium]|nr:HAMP domain-containing histidine kinase [Thermoleophilia bacterium]